MYTRKKYIPPAASEPYVERSGITHGDNNKILCVELVTDDKHSHTVKVLDDTDDVYANIHYYYANARTEYDFIKQHGFKHIHNVVRS